MTPWRVPNGSWERTQPGCSKRVCKSVYRVATMIIRPERILICIVDIYLISMRSLIVKNLLGVNNDDNMLGSLMLLAVFAVFSILSTHCFTTLRYLIQSFSDRRFKGKEPPTLPYQLPGIGSALDLIRNPHGFFDSIAYVLPFGSLNWPRLTQ